MNVLAQKVKLITIMGLSVAACSAPKYVEILSTNQNSRVDYLVIHATSGQFQESLRLLSTPNPNPVSSHYLVPDLRDPTYNSKKLRIYRLVSEDRRAWHAGVSQWGDEVSLNDRSIGIEIVNDFTCEDRGNVNQTVENIQLECEFPKFPEAQIDAVVSLIEDILGRHPDIDPVDIIGHSDIAPNRKSDPGPNFPWEELYDRGIGAWYEEIDLEQQLTEIRQRPPSILDVQCALSTYGYPIDLTGKQDKQSQFAFRAFQLHFRPSNFSGFVDEETTAILYALNKKYRGKLVSNEPSCQEYR
jgi:N-acetylmuramoyl-L-alanine amidase